MSELALPVSKTRSYFHCATLLMLPLSCLCDQTEPHNRADVNVIQIVYILLEGKIQEGLYYCYVESEINPGSEYFRGQSYVA